MWETRKEIKEEIRLMCSIQIVGRVQNFVKNLKSKERKNNREGRKKGMNGKQEKGRERERITLMMQQRETERSNKWTRK